MKFWRLMGEYDGEAATYGNFAGGAGASPYTPDFSGTLLGLRVIASREAATSKTNHVQIKMTCNVFRPNAIECGVEGTGLQTAPACGPVIAEWPVLQPVVAGVPITLEGRCPGAETSVTNEVFLYGLFQIGKQ